MRIGLVCGDGLPVSGLLTVARSVIGLGVGLGVVETPVIADLGYSWRPDKPQYFPAGPPAAAYPAWLNVGPGLVIHPREVETRGRDLVAIRDGVARYDQLHRAERDTLGAKVAVLEAEYGRHLTDWLDEYQIDMVIAVNMTLSDAVPVTAGLTRAAAIRYGRPGLNRRGGILWWDHDLFASCAVPDPVTDARLYPPAPNELTPVPQREPWTRWAVVSRDLAAEASQYPTGLHPHLAPNILPTIPTEPLGEQHHGFAAQHDLDPDRPILLAPVRIFRVKGVELAIDIHAAAAAEARRTGQPIPYLLIFGDRAEEPDYGAELTAHVRSLHVRWLDGVPLATHQGSDGRWHLDEVDLLRLAVHRGGAVLFTPSVPDVETVGLGPALAAAAGLPALVTPYDVFDDTYGPEFFCLTTKTTPDDLHHAGHELLTLLARQRRRDPQLAAALDHNRTLIQRRFSPAGWTRLWHDLADLAEIGSPPGP